jgi:enoyl-CoA hydratase/carnithine racemase
MADSILVARDGHVATVTFNRPEQRNALDPEARDRLDVAMGELETDTEIRVVVLTGAGTAFCAGTDLSAGNAAAVMPARARRLVAAVEEFSKPVIAAVNGGAAGGGFEFALAADLRVASPFAKFLLPEVRIGSLPGSGGTQRIFAALPSAIAWKILLTGAPLDADDALRYGLVSDVFPAETFAADVAALAARIAEGAPLSLRAAKRAGRAAIESAEGHALERRLWAELAETRDRAEGRAAFRERRPPRFEGR